MKRSLQGILACHTQRGDAYFRFVHLLPFHLQLSLDHLPCYRHSATFPISTLAWLGAVPIGKSWNGTKLTKHAAFGCGHNTLSLEVCCSQCVITNRVLRIIDLVFAA